MNMKPENYDWNTEDEWLALGGRERAVGLQANHLDLV